MKPIILSLGGSILVPDQVDVVFVRKFRAFILDQIKKGRQFVIVVGGGRTPRRYQDAAKEVTEVLKEDLDWLGIHATRLNAHLLRTVFRDVAYQHVIKDPAQAPRVLRKPLLIAAGWKPGRSTDDVAVRLAHRLSADTVINMSNISYVYNKDPKRFKDAKPVKDMTWTELRKIVGSRWNPGLHAPFDPIASKFAQEKKINVIIIEGTRLRNVQSWIETGNGMGTRIHS
jgi:uridylate kinase